VGAGINIDSLSGDKWDLRDVVIDRPVAHLLVNQAGESNLPQPEKNDRSTANIFDVAIQEFVLHGRNQGPD
jgi:hypothetical protein